MNYLDYIVVGFLLGGLIFGYFKGFLDQLFTVIGLVAGYWIARTYSDDVADWLTGNFEFFKTQTALIAFTGTFIVVYIIVKIVGSSLQKTIDEESVKSVNSMLGSLLGAVKYLIILLIIDIFILQAKLPPESDLTQSKFYKLVRKQSVLVLKFVDIPYIDGKR